MTKFFKPHFPIIILVLTVGVLYGSPGLILKIKDYRLLYPSYRPALESENQFQDGTMNDSLYYFSLIRDVSDGGFPLREAYTYEGKTLPARPHALGETLLGFLVVILGSVDRMKILMGFIGPAFIAWLLYRLAKRLTGNEEEALLAVAIGTLGMYPAIKFLWTEPNSIIGIGPYDRIPHPLLSAIPYLLFLIATYKLSDRRSGYSQSLICGICLGFLIYFYFFFWAHGMVLIGLWAFYFLINKQYLTFKKYLAAILVSGLVLIPFILLTLKIPSDIRADYMARETLVHGRNLFLSGLIPPSLEAALLHLLGFIGIGLLFLPQKKESYSDFSSQGFSADRRQGAWFLIVMMVASLIAANQQLVTGIILDPKHYYYRCFKLALAIGIAVTLANIAFYLNRRLKVRYLWTIPIFVLILIGIWVQVLYVRNYQQRYNIDPGLEATFLWLNENTPKDSVVLTGIGTGSILPVYTHNNILLRHGKDYSTDEDIQKRLALWIKLLDLKDQDFKEYLSEGKRLQFFLNCVPWRYYPEFRDPSKTEEWIDQILSLSKTTDLNFQEYRLDYLVWGPEEKLIPASPEALSRLKQNLVWKSQDGEYEIYDLR